MKRLADIAYARSGDKGSSANIGVIANDEVGYQYLVKNLTKKVVLDYFAPIGVESVERYELPNLLALNFVLKKALDGGASLSLRVDSQGKLLGQALLMMPMK